MPSESTPSGHRSRTAKAARAQDPRTAGTPAPPPAGRPPRRPRPRHGRTARRRGWRPPSRRARRRWRRSRPGRAGGRAGPPRCSRAGRARWRARPSPRPGCGPRSSPRGPRRWRGRAGPSRARARGRWGGATRRRPGRPAPRRTTRSRRARRRCRAWSGRCRPVRPARRGRRCRRASGPPARRPRRTRSRGTALRPPVASRAARCAPSGPPSGGASRSATAPPLPACDPAPPSTRSRPPAPDVSSPTQPNDEVWVLACRSACFCALERAEFFAARRSQELTPRRARTDTSADQDRHLDAQSTPGRGGVGTGSVAGEGAMAREMRLGCRVRRSSTSAAVAARRPALMPSQRSGSGSQGRDRCPTQGSRTRSVSRRSTRSRERPPGQVGGADAVADVPAGPGQPGRAVQPDRGAPVARHAERAAPDVRDPVVGDRGEQVHQGRGAAAGRPGSRRRSVARVLDARKYGAPRPPKTSRSSAVRWP